MFYVPSTAKSFRDGTTIYCPLWRTRSSVFKQNMYWFSEAIPFVPEKWPFKRGRLLSGVEINEFMFQFTFSSGLYKGVTSRQGGLSKGVQLYSYAHPILRVKSLEMSEKKYWYGWPQYDKISLMQITLSDLKLMKLQTWALDWWDEFGCIAALGVKFYIWHVRL